MSTPGIKTNTLLRVGNYDRDKCRGNSGAWLMQDIVENERRYRCNLPDETFGPRSKFLQSRGDVFGYKIGDSLESI
jgi:hypothetical protein